MAEGPGEVRRPEPDGALGRLPRRVLRRGLLPERPDLLQRGDDAAGVRPLPRRPASRAHRSSSDTPSRSWAGRGSSGPSGRPTSSTTSRRTREPAGGAAMTTEEPARHREPRGEDPRRRRFDLRAQGAPEGLRVAPRPPVAGEAGDGLEAVRLCAALAPDIVTLDIQMPGMDGLAALGRDQAALALAARPRPGLGRQQRPGDRPGGPRARRLRIRRQGPVPVHGLPADGRRGRPEGPRGPRRDTPAPPLASPPPEGRREAPRRALPGESPPTATRRRSASGPPPVGRRRCR